MRTWMVRAGRGGRFFEDFRESSIVAIGWAAVGNLSAFNSREELAEAVREAYPSFRDQAVAMAAGQLFRFAKEFAGSDRVVTYDPGARKYLCGEIIGPYDFQPKAENEELRNQRKVTWASEFPRDELSETARNTLGALPAVFQVPNVVSSELWKDDRDGYSDWFGDDLIKSVEVVELGATTESTDDDIASLASEAIKDQIARLDWQQMQELVAGLLRAMGYKTTVSPAGPDRGKDIIASPDGLGFQEPRIVVEVKHRRAERMGANEIRSFIGGRHPSEKGLYVSTGGFTHEARLEADRSSIPLTLMDFELLVDSILDHYADFDEVTKQLLPLKRIYWPVRE
jgi:restriction system protein